MPSLEKRLEARLQRLERIHATAIPEVVGLTEAGIEQDVAKLREAGYTGPIRIGRIVLEFVSPPPRDEAGNIIGPAPPSSFMEELWRPPTS
jgi:hypothetical protein